ncbi:MAG: LPS assembly protein LptD [Deltaproteobacteria bacterium]|nr:LPS assembly protein LptD [Deltaproteobacteria bacterium]
MVRQRDVSLRAERVELDLGQRTAAADGDVVLENKDGELRAPTIFINFYTQRGVIVRGNLVVRTPGGTNFYFRGQRIEKVGENHYLILDGWYSTCDCGQEEADWYIEAEEIDVTLDGYAIVRRGRLYTGGLAVAYLPFGVVPAKITRQTGFLSPQMGWASDDGYHFGIPFFWAIDDHVDATLYSDYYEKRGLKEGFEYRYALTRGTRGQVDVDYIDDRLYGERRWALSQEHRQNLYRRLSVRSKTNVVSDNDYVNDFPSDITGRYDRFLRSDFMMTNLWQNASANANVQYFDDLAREDNSYTWQKLPELRLDAVSQRIAGLPLAWRLATIATNFDRPKIDPTERIVDLVQRDGEPFLFMTTGRRVDFLPEVAAPISFNRYAFLRPAFELHETLYDLPDRTENDRYPARHLYTARADLFTRTERVFPVTAPIVKGVKHTVEPGARYEYRPPATEQQEELPIFDGDDRIARSNLVTYYLANRLWLRMLPPRSRLRTTQKLVDLEVSQSYDIHESERELEDDEDERRPLGPVHGELRSVYTAGMWLNKIVLRSGLDYNTYRDEVQGFNVLTSLGTVTNDALGAEYRFSRDEEGYREIEYLSGLARYTLFDFLTLSYLARYSYTDSDFIEQLYGVEFHSAQNCWNLILQAEQRSIPENETVYKLTVDLTGLVTAGTAF